MDELIIARPPTLFQADEPSDPPPPPPQYFRITPIILHTGHWLHIADGVILESGVAWLGQATGGAAPDFRVAPFLVGNTPAYAAPRGWQADVQAASSLNTQGDGDEPPPTSPAWLPVIAARGAVVQIPHCPVCQFVCAYSGSRFRCLAPRCTWERPATAADRRRLVADVTRSEVAA